MVVGVAVVDCSVVESQPVPVPRYTMLDERPERTIAPLDDVTLTTCAGPAITDGSSGPKVSDAADNTTDAGGGTRMETRMITGWLGSVALTVTSAVYVPAGSVPADARTVKLAGVEVPTSVAVSHGATACR